MDGTMDRDTAIARIAKNTRVYAKKQLTWLKRDPSVIKLSPSTALVDALDALDADQPLVYHRGYASVDAVK